MSNNQMLSWTGLIGGDGPVSFNDSKFGDTPALVQYMEVYKNSGSLIGILLRYTDQQVFRTGRFEGDKASITFKPGERVTFLGLWGNGVGTRCAGITLRTDRDQSLDLVVDRNKNQYPMDVASGLLAGVYGEEGSEFDCLGFIFVKPINSLSITIADADWINNPNGDGASIRQATLAQALIKNPDKDSLDWAFNGSSTVTNSQTFTQASTTTWGVSVEISAGLFDIVNVKETTSWSQAKTTSNASTSEQATTMGTTIGGKLAKGEAVFCSSLCLLGTLNLKYTSVVKIVTQNGDTMTFREPGRFQNAVYAYSQMTSTKVPLDGDAVVERRL